MANVCASLNLVIIAMDIKYKIKLVEILRLRPADLEFIDSIKLSDECLVELLKDDKALLDKELEAIVSNETNENNTRLIAASLRTHLLWNSASDAIDEVCEDMVAGGYDYFEDFPVEETWESKLYKEKQGNPQEREKSFKEAKKLIERLSKEELIKRYCEFIMEKYPQLKDGFDNGLYRMGMSDYHEYLGINGKEYLFPTELSHKVYFARRGVMEELNRMIDELYFEQLDSWKAKYKSWLEQRHETRISKKSIKTFFDEHGKKVSDKVLDKMKMEL